MTRVMHRPRAKAEQVNPSTGTHKKSYPRARKGGAGGHGTNATANQKVASKKTGDRRTAWRTPAISVKYHHKIYPRIMQQCVTTLF